MKQALIIIFVLIVVSVFALSDKDQKYLDETGWKLDAAPGAAAAQSELTLVKLNKVIKLLEEQNKLLKQIVPTPTVTPTVTPTEVPNG